MGAQRHSFLTLALDVCQQSSSTPTALRPAKKPSDSQDGPHSWSECRRKADYRAPICSM
jgi:hypothetical protein